MLHYTLFRACRRHVSVECVPGYEVKRLALTVLRGTLCIVVWINGPPTWVARSTRMEDLHRRTVGYRSMVRGRHE